mmetsp:Transcript_10338/g.20095  ORF Transcript_10338/g.20095 Transcript_10338/m.20095 type:complete len:87 (+) Transcript_10338:266-526(+)
MNPSSLLSEVTSQQDAQVVSMFQGGAPLGIISATMALPVEQIVLVLSQSALVLNSNFSDLIKDSQKFRCRLSGRIMREPVLCGVWP